ncbi:hypothetical protein [Paraburkholderia haematera]|uniref:Uncharacterized protein n=1 Tax=Paraburkholderia haematera TaxID=2793077 RepID=A0ABM8SV48_9BURK|nr:hypothetical protein [Paraburkholderia haematera]CAE6835464.1 hypothetical protein R69888_06748 [Paraburkholderia haematera]
MMDALDFEPESHAMYSINAMRGDVRFNRKYGHVGAQDAAPPMQR